jgi:hypothetical protein
VTFEVRCLRNKSAAMEQFDMDLRIAGEQQEIKMKQTSYKNRQIRARNMVESSVDTTLTY